jgi:hypothetical protein
MTSRNADSDRTVLGAEECVPAVTLTIKQWAAWRKAAGRQIVPKTAEVEWWYALTLDPYGVCNDLPDECKQVGREYFARSPETDVWISFADLPDATRNALWEKHKANLAFPAGLPVPDQTVRQRRASVVPLHGTGVSGGRTR